MQKTVAFFASRSLALILWSLANCFNLNAIKLALFLAHRVVALCHKTSLLQRVMRVNSNFYANLIAKMGKSFADSKKVYYGKIYIRKLIC